MFKFKQFTINQSKTAMKVCTDACIFGAYIEVGNSKKILDIGTGTGLLSMMLAQKTTAKIDAIEIDTDAYKQAIENISASPFNQNINIFHQSIQNFSTITENQYDLIISNPPFYQNSLKSPDNQSNKAHHAETLTFDDLMISITKLLKSEGKFMVLLPPFEMKVFIEITIKNGFYLHDKLQIRHSTRKNIFREICTFSRNETVENTQTELYIYEEDHKTYSDKFRNLLKDYYLIF